MKINIFNKSIFDKPKEEQNYKKTIDMWWKSFGTFDKRDYKSAILYGIADQIFNAVETIEMWEGDKDNVRVMSKNYADVRYIMLNKFRNIFFDLYKYGFFCLTQTPRAIEYFPAKYIRDIRNEKVYVKEGVNVDDDAELKVYYDKTYEIEGKSIRDILQPHFNFIDDLLNSGSTGVKRLGNVNILTPPNNQDGGEILDKTTRESTEKYFRENYGGLEHQSNIAILSRAFDLKSIAFDFGKLQINEQFTREAQIICSKLQVPYDLLPYSGQSTFNNQAEAVKLLYKTADRWIMYLQHIFDLNYGVKFNYELLGKPTEDAREYEDTRAKAIENVRRLVEMGIFTTEQAKEELSKYYDL